MKTNRRVLVVADTEGGSLSPLTLELLRAGDELAPKGNNVLTVCLIGSGLVEPAAELAGYADEVVVLDDPLLATSDAHLRASALARLCEELTPQTIILGHTYENMELAPKLAFRTGSELVTDCIHIERDPHNGNRLLCTKPIYGGNAVAEIAVAAKPQMVTVRAKVWSAAVKGSRNGEVRSFDCKAGELHPQTESVALVAGENVNLDKADVIVAAGRGMKTAEAVAGLAPLLKVLRNHFDKVELGASRPVVDAGILPRSRQIGQTGEKVSPQLYIAVGISGSTQHVAGITDSMKIVAINKDGEAPIFEAADYGVVGSYEDVLPAFIAQLEKLS